MKKFIMVAIVAMVTSCGTSKMVSTTPMTPFNIKEYQDTDIEYRAYGIGTSPNVQLRRVEAINDALSQISSKVNSDVVTAFEEYTQQINYKDTMVVRKMVENYRKSVSNSNLRGWTMINESVYNDQYHVIIGVNKGNTLQEKVDILNDVTYNNLKVDLSEDKSKFVQKQNIQ